MQEIRWHGRGGQGAFTASKILGAAAVLDGKYALSFPSFGPERRGAPIQAFTKIGKSPIHDRSVIKKCDYIIFLDETLYLDSVKKDLKENGKILLNTKNPEKYTQNDIVAIDADGIAEKILGRPVVNTAMIGLLAAISNVADAEKVKAAMEFYLPSKITEKNKQVVRTIIDTYGK